MIVHCIGAKPLPACIWFCRVAACLPRSFGVQGVAGGRGGISRFLRGENDGWKTISDGINIRLVGSVIARAICASVKLKAEAGIAAGRRSSSPAWSKRKAPELRSRACVYG